MTAVQAVVPREQKEKPVSIQEVMAAMARLQAAAEALAAVGARAAVTESDGFPSEVAGAVDNVLTAAGVPDLSELPPPQRAMVAAFARSAFGQAANLLAEPTRSVGWSYTDPAVLEGQGRASMIAPTVLAQSGEFDDVTSFLDVGTGVGWLAVGAAEVWPNSTIVGIDTWEPSLERARTNVAGAGVADRIELRNQEVTDLTDRDRFDLTWVPSFFLTRDVVATAFERIFAATRPGGQIVVARYDPPPDPLADATLRLRTIRDGGSWLETDEIVELLCEADWTDVRVVAKTGPAPLTFVAGRKA
jgi:predicted O-methyltransferase YrrM